LRLGAGALLGSLRDERSGRFTTSAGTAYQAAPVSDKQSASFFYLDPEVRVGFRLGTHFELSAGAEMPILIALSQAKWDRSIQVNASTDGLGAYPEEALTSSVLVTIAPGAGLRYDF
jgi:hypothetical protein